MDGAEPWKLGGLGSGGSQLRRHPEGVGTSMGRQGGGEVPLRLEAEGETEWVQGTRGGGELPEEGTEPQLRSRRSVTDTPSSPGLEDHRRNDS